MSSSSTTPRPHPRPAGMDEKGHMLYQRLARDCLFCQLARAGNARLLDGTSFKKTRSARSKGWFCPGMPRSWPVLRPTPTSSIQGALRICLPRSGNSGANGNVSKRQALGQAEGAYEPMRL